MIILHDLQRHHDHPWPIPESEHGTPQNEKDDILPVGTTMFGVPFWSSAGREMPNSRRPLLPDGREIPISQLFTLSNLKIRYTQIWWSNNANQCILHWNKWKWTGVPNIFSHAQNHNLVLVFPIISAQNKWLARNQSPYLGCFPLNPNFKLTLEHSL